MMQYTCSLPGAPPSPIQKRIVLCFFQFIFEYFVTCWYFRVPSIDLKLLWSMRGEVKFRRFCRILMLQSFDNLWPAEALKEAKRHAKIPYLCRKF